MMQSSNRGNFIQRNKAYFRMVSGNFDLTFQVMFFFNSFVCVCACVWLCQVVVLACKTLAAASRIQFPDQGSNLGPLHRQHRVLATRPPRKPLQVIFSGPHWYALTRQWNQSPHTNIFIGRLKISDKEMLENTNLKIPVSASRLQRISYFQELIDY